MWISPTVTGVFMVYSESFHYLTGDYADDVRVALAAVVFVIYAFIAKLVGFWVCGPRRENEVKKAHPYFYSPLFITLAACFFIWIGEFIPSQFKDFQLICSLICLSIWIASLTYLFFNSMDIGISEGFMCLAGQLAYQHGGLVFYPTIVIFFIALQLFKQKTQAK